MGNTSYRGLLLFTGQDGLLQFGLSVGCITPSNTVGAFIQLQYANYTLATHTNQTNFVNVGGQVMIDNSVNNPCPGTVAVGTSTIPTFITGITSGYIFRVVGSGGGGPGDNPRFSRVIMQITQGGLVKTPVFVPISITNTGFTALIRVTYPLTTSTTEGFQWAATNSSNTNPGCGTNVTGGTFVCLQHGAGSCTALAGSGGCTSAIVFTTAFTGTTNVVGSGTSTGVSYTFPIGTISLLSAQTLTV